MILIRVEIGKSQGGEGFFHSEYFDFRQDPEIPVSRERIIERGAILAAKCFDWLEGQEK